MGWNWVLAESVWTSFSTAKIPKPTWDPLSESSQNLSLVCWGCEVVFCADVCVTFSGSLMSSGLVYQLLHATDQCFWFAHALFLRSFYLFLELMLKIKSGPAVGSEQNLLFLSVVICCKKSFQNLFWGSETLILRLTAESFTSSTAGEKEENGTATRYRPDSKLSFQLCMCAKGSLWTEGANMMQNCNFSLNLRMQNSNEIHIKTFEWWKFKAV